MDPAPLLALLQQAPTPLHACTLLRAQGGQNFQLCGVWAGALSGRLLRAPFTPLPQMKSVSCSKARLWTFPFCLNPGEAQTALGECFVCVSMCVITLDTVDLEVGLG